MGNISMKQTNNLHNMYDNTWNDTHIQKDLKIKLVWENQQIMNV